MNKLIHFYLKMKVRDTELSDSIAFLACPIPYNFYIEFSFINKILERS